MITKNLSAKLIGMRMWIQTSFLMVWLDPLGLRLHTFCSPVFHCYACPLSTFACPIGVIAQFSALHVIPFIAIGLLVAVGALFGTLICGWVCPFGLLQDLAGNIPTKKFILPKFTGHFRYVVLIVSVLAIPYFFGVDEHWLSICRYCPAGAIEKRVPDMVSQIMAGNLIIKPDSYEKIVVLVLFISALFFFRRPWCKVLCPLGAIFSLFNKASVFFLKFDPAKCTDCKRCHKLCNHGVEPEKSPNDLNCIRCLECTNCGPKALKLDNIFSHIVNKKEKTKN